VQSGSLLVVARCFSDSTPSWFQASATQLASSHCQHPGSATDHAALHCFCWWCSFVSLFK